MTKTIKQMQAEIKDLARKHAKHCDNANNCMDKIDENRRQIMLKRMDNIRDGDRIKHMTMGKGTVTELNLILGFINIDFDRGGEKKLIIAFAYKRIRKVKE